MITPGFELDIVESSTSLKQTSTNTLQNENLTRFLAPFDANPETVGAVRRFPHHRHRPRGQLVEAVEPAPVVDLVGGGRRAARRRSPGTLRRVRRRLGGGVVRAQHPQHLLGRYRALLVVGGGARGAVEAGVGTQVRAWKGEGVGGLGF